MGKRISDEERMEEYFMREAEPKCQHQLNRMELIMRTRFPTWAKAKRGRPRKPKAKPPIAADTPMSIKATMEPSR